MVKLSASVVLHLCVKRHASKADRADWTVVDAFIIMPTENHFSSFDDGLAFFVLLRWLLSPNLRRRNLPVAQLDRISTCSQLSLAETAEVQVHTQLCQDTDYMHPRLGHATRNGTEQQTRSTARH